MKKMIFVCAAGFGLLAGCATSSAQHAARSPATTQSQVSAPEETDAEATEVAAADQPGGEKVICENGPTTGSRLPRVVCRTPREMEEEREASQRWLREGQRQPRFQ